MASKNAATRFEDPADRLVPRSVYRVINTALALVVSFVFFILVSTLHDLFGFGQKKEGGEEKRRQVLAEVIRKPPPEKKQVQQRVRQVQQANKGGRSEGDQMAMRFSPDLGLDAGEGGSGVEMARQDLQAEVFEEGQTDEDASPVFQPGIPYPERARELNVEGKFIALYIVNHQGKVVSLNILKSPHPLFDSEARKVVMTWKFKPAKNKGVPVNQRRKLMVDFTLAQ